MVSVFFLVAFFAHQRARFHVPLPSWLVPVLVGLYFLAADSAQFMGLLFLLLPQHEFLCFLDVAISAQDTFHFPFFGGTVFVTCQFLIADRAMQYLFLAENIVQASVTHRSNGYKNVLQIKELCDHPRTIQVRPALPAENENPQIVLNCFKIFH